MNSEIIGRLWNGFKFELVWSDSDFKKIDFLIKNGKCVFNRYLGIKDKNDVMIFEKDLFKKQNHNLTFIVIFDGFKWVGIDCGCYHCYTDKITSEPSDLIYLNDNIEGIEVTTNIFECQ